jgi:hypothetical protein
VLVVTATWQLGLAGYRFGGVAVPFGLAAAFGLSTWAVFTAGRPGRGLWTTSAVVIGIVLGAVLVDAAPPSSGVLSAELDGIRLDFYEVLTERREGHSWCRPSCPSVTRVYRAPNTSDRANSATVVAGLRGAGLVTVPDRFVPPTRLAVRRTVGERRLEVTTFRDEDTGGGSPLRVRIRLASDD